ncbi:MAG: hypothetical protein WDM84_09180 [Bauldia sp.]
MTPGLIDADFRVTDDAVRNFLGTFLSSFADWIGKLTGVVPEPGQPDDMRL